MNRIPSPAMLAGGFLIALLSCCPARGEGRQNFIFIYTDDQRFDALGKNGNAVIRTPNLDRLSDRGVRFTNAFVVLSLCSPSRVGQNVAGQGTRVPQRSGGLPRGIAGRRRTGERGPAADPRLTDRQRTLVSVAGVPC